MIDQSLLELSKQLHLKQISSVELTQYCLQQMQAHQHLNAFISIDEEGALKEAQKADVLLQRSQGSLLTGIPMVVKDNLCTLNMPTTCASKMLADYHSPIEATAVSRLKALGAFTIAKTNLDEFAMGSTTENSFFGPTKNPWDVTLVPGGSSGGSAAAVAARLAPFALGSDTGGSIRQPAAFCGISGIKPTYGLVSRWGLVAYASSLDQAGPIAKSAEDLAVLLQGMIGFDSKDSTSVHGKTVDYLMELTKPLQGYKVGLPTSFFQKGLDKDIQVAVVKACDAFKQLGMEIVEVDLSLYPLWVPTYYVIACAEASSNLSRYDGIRYGHRSKHQQTLKELITHSRSEGFGKEVQRRILTGTHVLSSGYYDAYYLQALKIRKLIQDELLQVLEQVDVIIGPTTATIATALGQEQNNPVASYLQDVYTVAANLAGLPALSIPTGFKDGLPIGLQLMGRHFQDALLLAMAHQYQNLTNWHQISPMPTGDL